MLPFPCVVYERKRAMDPFVIRHSATRKIKLPTLKSLRVSDLRNHYCNSERDFLLKTKIVVFVTGDTATSHSCLDLIHDTEQPKFLFSNCCFDDKFLDNQPQPTELSGSHVMVYFFSWILAYRKDLTSKINPFQGGVLLFPTLWTKTTSQHIPTQIRNILVDCSAKSMCCTSNHFFYSNLNKKKSRYDPID
jgi:hypothetical protein